MPLPPPPQANVNGLAITSLITGIVCCVPLLGLVLGGFALAQIKKKGERGKGLAVAGMTVSLVGALLMATGFATGVFRDAYDGFQEAADESARTRSTLDLRKGQCFDMPGGVAETETADVEIVKCSEPHDGEVSGSFKLTEFDKWPGDKPIEPIAEERCEAVNNQYALDTWAVPGDTWTYYYQPSKESWRLGDRVVTCSFAAEKGKMTGSVRADESTLDAHQLAFLKAVNPVDIILAEQPEPDADEDLDANVKWAGQVTSTIGETVRQLRAHQWPAASAKPVAGLVEELEAADEHWSKAAEASDPDVFWEHYDPGFDALPNDLGAKARGALGLADELEDTGGTDV
ncbi:DUF4190 domain-containing protein [Streptomyces sp. SP18CS02]|uniref:DUF4190 domain-containing protein n=1 Tax=Streptomyces sp. SP18CS02 TaxID=3002531 RepID=UPI002E78E15B|nr:DUF4190 domain-containing protein [Streptomyces sp. SP18CS02]MEE1756350.1 DUF4190 domain-containing protein [Streptomyces sp. SP18CS02]